MEGKWSLGLGLSERGYFRKRKRKDIFPLGEEKREEALSYFKLLLRRWRGSPYNGKRRKEERKEKPISIKNGEEGEIYRSPFSFF